MEHTLTSWAVLDDPVNAPSPRYWLVWPGTMLLLAGSFAEVAANYRTIYASVAQLFQPVIRLVTRRNAKYDEANVIVEPCSPDEMVPTWMWGGGIVVSIVRILASQTSPKTHFEVNGNYQIFTCVIMAVQFKLSVGQTLLAILFAFIFSFIGAESTGRTNITPVTSIGNASQLIIVSNQNDCQT